MSLYQAVVNLSVPRKGDPGKETDLVIAGETVELDDETAALFLPPKRAVPMIRTAKESGEVLPRIVPRQLSGIRVNPRTGLLVGMPGPPEGARPDPAGSSAVQVMEPPEANEPQPGTETGPDQDAVDIPPRNRRTPAKTG
jgi:hypothetical protein